MTRRLGLAVLAFSLFATVALQSDVQAQSITIGRGGVRYDAYGRGYYGGYGRGYNGYFPGNQHYSGYGYGPYGSSSGGAVIVRPRAGAQYENGAYYNGYGSSGYYGQTYTPVYAPVYSPYGYGTYNSYRW